MATDYKLNYTGEEVSDLLNTINSLDYTAVQINTLLNTVAGLNYTTKEVNTLLTIVKNLNYTPEEVNTLLDTVKVLESNWESMPCSQTGFTAVTTSDANVDTVKQVAFKVKFNNEPNITILPISDNQVETVVTVSNVTTTDFNFVVNSANDNTTTNIYWIAVEP